MKKRWFDDPEYAKNFGCVVVLALFVVLAWVLVG